mmetsp:Transcript_87170/g.266770  ORF Transcript_87170/g.266770 Transcript_87170/m.266770 type:complete len:103 (-) Transcript_87170:191-499(-)
MAFPVIATFAVVADKAAAFESAFQKLADSVKANEPGCLLYQLTKKSDTCYIVVEMWADKDALANHEKQAYFMDFVGMLDDWLSDKPDIQALSPVGSSGGSRL